MCVYAGAEAGKHSGLLKHSVLIYFKAIIFLSTRTKFINSGKYKGVRHFLAIKRVEVDHTLKMSAPIWKSP